MVNNSTFSRAFTPAVLVLANLIPLWGVLYAGWDIFSLAVLYWLETVATALFGIAKMLHTRRKSWNGSVVQDGQAVPVELEDFESVRIIRNFILFFGVALVLMGLFIFQIFARMVQAPALDSAVILVPLGCLFVSHLISYLFNFLGKQEYRSFRNEHLVSTLVVRLLAMHFAIIVGGVFMERYHQPTIVPVLLIAIKILIDIVGHLEEHYPKTMTRMWELAEEVDRRSSRYS